MNKEIRIVKRAAQELLQAETEQKAVALRGIEEKEASPLKMTRTIKEWVSAHRQRATEELLAARSLQRCGL